MNKIQDRLRIAIAKGETEEVKALLEAGAKTNTGFSTGWTPLMVAAEHENIKMIDLLIAYGAEINKADPSGQTPLHIAVDISIDGIIQDGGNYGDEPTETILCLLKHGADLNAKDNKGQTPFDWACNYRSQKIIRLLQTFQP
ncbi:MAG: ankyrin repeat domain-containing protein [Anaerolineales bacterium]|nr:ankyrin repeat domain-containing protein [Anaerolineales bacterium]